VTNPNRHPVSGQYVAAASTDQNGGHPASSRSGAILAGLQAGMRAGGNLVTGYTAITMNAPGTGHQGTAMVATGNMQQPMPELGNPVHPLAAIEAMVPSHTAPTGHPMGKVAAQVGDQLGRAGDAQRSPDWASQLNMRAPGDLRSAVAATYTPRPETAACPTGLHRQWGGRA
jgi:hypothetical protein